MLSSLAFSFAGARAVQAPPSATTFLKRAARKPAAAAPGPRVVALDPSAAGMLQARADAARLVTQQLRSGRDGGLMTGLPGAWRSSV